MSASKTENEILLEKLADGLDSTSRLTHALLTEIKESEADFAAIKTELAILRENVKSLSIIIREGNGATSLLTKIALIEQKLEGVDKWLDSHADVHQRYKQQLSKLKDDIEDVDKRLEKLEQIAYDTKSKIDEREKIEKEAIRESINREADLIHIEKKNKISTVAAKQQGFIKLVVGIVLALVGGITGWMLK